MARLPVALATQTGQTGLPSPWKGEGITEKNREFFRWTPGTLARESRWWWTPTGQAVINFAFDCSDLRNDYNDTNHVQSAMVLDHARTIYLLKIAASLSSQWQNWIPRSGRGMTGEIIDARMSCHFWYEGRCLTFWQFPRGLLYWCQWLNCKEKTGLPD